MRVASVRKLATTGFHFLPCGLPVKARINQIGGRLLIVTNRIAHQDVGNVVVDGNGLFEARHGKVRSEK